MGARGLLLSLVLGLCFREEQGFYIPGVAPEDFTQGQPIDVKAVKLTSMKTQLPYEFYTVPFCKPPGGHIEYKSENLGEILRGDRIVNTAYKVKMRTNTECMSLCEGTEPLSVSADDGATLFRRIQEEYHVHLLIDNLPCATRLQIPGQEEVFYDHGYKLGYVAEDGKVFVNNHLHMTLKYHQHAEGAYRVVGFEVSPRSVAWDAVKAAEDGTCTPNNGDFSKLTPQELVKDGDNKVRWTYSVSWEESEVRWASRWDIYLAMRDVQIHWFSIVNSIVVVLCLTGFLSIIIIRTVRKDIANYNAEEDIDETLEETGWKLVHGDVFRPPHNTRFLVVLIGSGLQLAGVAMVTLFFAMLGMLSPASRGSLMSAALFLYCFMGLVAGYFAGRLYKTLRGVQWKRAAFQTGAFFPGVVFGSGFILNFFIWGKASSGAVPFTTMLALLCMWAGIDLPLVFLGFYFGFRKQSYSHPVRTNQIPRQVPEQPWYLNTLPCIMLSGVLPFGAMFIELFFIFSAIWENQFYYLFGFLFLVFIILIVSAGQIAIVVTYFQLCAENYHWWWRSFIVSGGSAFYVFAYSIFYFCTKLEIVGFIPSLLYFGYSALMAVTFWLLLGAVGFFASWAFVIHIYAAVKID